MPILTATDPPRKRLVPGWWLAPTMLVALLAGTFAWSWMQSVCFRGSTWQVEFGRIHVYPPLGAGSRILPGYSWNTSPHFRRWAIKVPGGRTTGWYGGGWSLR